MRFCRTKLSSVAILYICGVHVRDVNTPLITSIVPCSCSLATFRIFLCRLTTSASMPHRDAVDAIWQLFRPETELGTSQSTAVGWSASLASVEGDRLHMQHASITSLYHYHLNDSHVAWVVSALSLFPFGCINNLCLVAVSFIRWFAFCPWTETTVCLRMQLLDVYFLPHSNCSFASLTHLSMSKTRFGLDIYDEQVRLNIRRYCGVSLYSPPCYICITADGKRIDFFDCALMAKLWTRSVHKTLTKKLGWPNKCMVILPPLVGAI